MLVVEYHQPIVVPHIFLIPYMYNNRSRNHSRGRGKNKYRNASNFGRFARAKKPRYGKRLDHNLFINKSSDTPRNLSNSVTHSFSDFPIHIMLQANIASHDYKVPTPIQDQAIPVILQGKDVIGIANTGTGKTAAFLIPLIHKVAQNRQEKVLIVAPTRELAGQINEEFMMFARDMRIYSVLTIGGASMYRQKGELKRGYNFVIGTPGRLKDLVKERCLDLSLFGNVVLDEVDRMVDIGFIKDIQYLVSLLKRERQSLFFSATVDNKVDGILQQFVRNSVTISVKTHSTASTIQQDIVRINGSEKKIDVLHDLLTQDGYDKVMIFGRTKWGVEKLANTLIDRGFKAAAIHGNKSLGNRRRALEAFKSNQIQILLATDVASRGIDVEDVTHVINYDAPESYDDYVHRIGRTGRASKKGIALTFVE